MSPGVNPLKDVETLGKQLGYTSADKNFHIVSLGQGQEVVAESAMNRGAKEGIKLAAICLPSVNIYTSLIWQILKPLTRSFH